MATYSISTTAIVTEAPKGTQIQWHKKNVRLREPLDGEILVRIIASGICHTDLVISSLPEGAPGLTSYPKVLGHEGAGIVEKIGSGVAHVKQGDKVLLSFDYCGKDDCRPCLEETPGHCPEFNPKNIFSVPAVYQSEDGNTAGGLFFGQSSFSNLTIARATSVVNVSHLVKDEEELKLFAPMGCGYQTGAAAVAELARAGEKDTVAIFGLGGVGMAALMAAKVRGVTTIIGVDRVQSRLDLAKGLGATHVIDTLKLPSGPADLTAAIKTIVPQGLSIIFEATGVIPLIEAGVLALGPKGQLILIGIVRGSANIELGAVLSLGISIHGCIEGGTKPSKFLPQMIEWYHEGKFPIDKLAKFYPADDFEKALSDMHSGATIKPILLW